MRSCSFLVAIPFLLTLPAGSASAAGWHEGCGANDWDTNDTPFVYVPPTVNLWLGEECYGASASAPGCGYSMHGHVFNVHVLALGFDCHTGVLVECDEPGVPCP